MKILITGAAGFIGFHLVKALLERGDTIVGVDNINDYYDVSLKYSRLNQLSINIEDIEYGKPLESTMFSHYTFIKLDISDRVEMEHLFSSYSFDVVCNLAAQAGVRYSIENPQAYIQSNIVGFANIIEGCRHSKVNHLVYASSSSVYGLNKKVPFSTSDNVDYPISLYAATKKSNELMAHTYSHLYGIPSTGLRFFTVYGPWGRPDMAYFLFAKAILSGQSIKVFNNGDMSRDFTYIDDIIDGIIRVIDNPPIASEKASSLSKAPYSIYNIGNNSPVNLLKFIETIEAELGLVTEKVMLPMQDGDVYMTYADVTNLVDELGYKPKTNLKEGISSFTTWFKEFYSVK